MTCLEYREPTYIAIIMKPQWILTNVDIFIAQNKTSNELYFWKESHWDFVNVMDISPVQYLQNMYMFIKGYLVKHQERSCKGDLPITFTIP